jgi:hypothetical protein
MYPDATAPGSPRLSFSTGPNIYSWVGIMFAAIAVLVSALKLWMPTAPPAAQLAGGEVLAAAEAHQRLLAAILLLAGLAALAALARWRRCVIDFDSATVRVSSVAATGGGTRLLPFAALSHAEAWSSERDDVTLFGLTIHPLQGRPIRIGPVAMDWGGAELAGRLNAAIAEAGQAAPG